MRKLERIGPYPLDRPSLQAIWQPQLPDSDLAACRRHLRTLGAGRRRPLDLSSQGQP
jgi:hypothetical protein